MVRNYVAHGVGRVFHTDPIVHHSRKREQCSWTYGVAVTIEPMLTMRSIKPAVWDDNWTMVTEDASLSAQFKHTILITKHGAEILTNCQKI
ncbi:hypothetical protein YC2023_017474 [Brassica napus]